MNFEVDFILLLSNIKIPPNYSMRSYSILNSLKNMMNFSDNINGETNKVFSNKFGDIVKFNKNN